MFSIGAVRSPWFTYVVICTPVFLLVFMRRRYALVVAVVDFDMHAKISHIFLFQHCHPKQSPLPPPPPSPLLRMHAHMPHDHVRTQANRSRMLLLLPSLLVLVLSWRRASSQTPPPSGP